MSVELAITSGAPFWRRYVKLGKGKCIVGCLFCYNNRWEWAREDWIPYSVDKKTEKQFSGFKWVPGKCKQYEGQHDIMMCSVGDPFAEENMEATRWVLQLAREYPEVGNHLRVLSKLDGADVIHGHRHDAQDSAGDVGGDLE